jgi:hypothetical protein
VTPVEPVPALAGGDRRVLSSHPERAGGLAPSDHIDVMADDPPEALAARFSELVVVAEALAQSRSGKVTVACPRCGAALDVKSVVATGVTVVICANNHMLYRSKHV